MVLKDLSVVSTLLVSFATPLYRVGRKVRPEFYTFDLIERTCREIDLDLDFQVRNFFVFYLS